MSDNNEQQLRHLTQKAEELSRQQTQLATEIRLLQEHIRHLGSIIVPAATTTPTPAPVTLPPIQTPTPPRPLATPTPIEQKTIIPPVAPPQPRKPKQKTPLEEFIGTNLLNKVGIAVLVLGIAIGAKYAIEHDLISPLTRIVLGYVAGIVLIVLAIRLKAKYASFSAVLLSGGMAVMYFITFAAYDFYALIPQIFAFILMVLFTAFTVYAAIQYDVRAIAVIGLVGAYAVPFLLSDGSGRVAVMFTYMTIINAGILVLSFRKAWKVLYYVAFVLTWLIFAIWIVDQFRVTEHLWISLIFSSLFFITFYTSFLAYKFVAREQLSRIDVVVLLMNAFLYYGWGYFAISDHPDGDVFLGVFTVFNAVLHFIACAVIYKKQETSRDTFFFVAGMVLVFLTLAVPVQLDGHWVTLIWGAEAALLFWIGRTKGFPVYEKLAGTLIVLTFISLVQDWDSFYNVYDYDGTGTSITYFFNIQLLSSLLICGAWAWIVILIRRHPLEADAKGLQGAVVKWVLPGLVLLTLYMAFHQEIASYWQQRYYYSRIKAISESDHYSYDTYDETLMAFQRLCLVIYAAAFTVLLWLADRKWIKNEYLAHAISIFAALQLFLFITMGVYDSSSLITSYITQEDGEYYTRGAMYVAMRYITILSILPLLLILYRNVRAYKMNDLFPQAERVYFHIVVLVLLSTELNTLLALMQIDNSDRLAMSILWGAYALGLIVFGLMRAQRTIRVTGISLFGITLVKLFIYDMAAMSTISRTIVMVILGALLLLASFLYNKFKASKTEDDTTHAE